MAEVKLSNPGTLPKPAGAYSHIAEIEGARKLIVVAGQVTARCSLRMTWRSR
jgi:hypothetical protein